MAKKSTLSFKDGLESIFETMNRTDNSVSDEMPFFSEKPRPAAAGRVRTSSSKSFLTDLEDFFKDTIEETIADKFRKKQHEKKPDKPARRTKPMFGLDSLIESTVDTAQIKADATTKRITLTFEREKLDKLGQIADLERARIKDIIEQLIGSYISQYEGSPRPKAK